MKTIIIITHLFIIPLLVAQEAKITTFFEIQIKEGVQFDPSSLDGLFSSELLKVRNDMKPNDMTKAFPSAGFGKPDTFMGGETPGNSYLETIEVYYESGKLQNFSLSSLRVPPAKNRFLSWMLEIERLLGPPNLAFHDINDGEPDQRALMLVWSPNPNALTLYLNSSGNEIEMNLTYYPGPANPGLKRIAAIKRHAVPFQSFKTLLNEYITRVGNFPEDDAALTTLKLPEGEATLLREYCNQSILNPADMSRDEVEIKLPFITKIEEALDKHYGDLVDKEKYERLCLIAENKVAGFGSGEIQVGAARFLARHEDPKVLPFLFRGLKVELPEGVSMECEEGIAKRCDDALFDQLLEMEKSGKLPRENLAGILIAMPSKRHLEMLVRKREKLTGDHREMVSGAIEALRRYKLLD